jgi:hypothetical protein
MALEVLKFVCYLSLPQVPREQFLNASMSTVIATQLGVFGFKPEIQNEILAGGWIGE